MNGGRVARRLIVTGRVQGVGFRDFVLAQSRRLDLGGLVRNRVDGSVEIQAVGADCAIAALVEACRAGPSSARVDAVEVSDLDPAGLPEEFRRAPTI